jgi:hypothetical protein
MKNQRMKRKVDEDIKGDNLSHTCDKGDNSIQGNLADIKNEIPESEQRILLRGHKTLSTENESAHSKFVEEES